MEIMEKTKASCFAAHHFPPIPEWVQVFKSLSEAILGTDPFQRFADRGTSCFYCSPGWPCPDCHCAGVK